MRFVDYENRGQYIYHDDPDGAWNIIEFRSIMIHVMTEEGRNSLACQRVERRLIRNARIVPIKEWFTIEDTIYDT